MQEFFQWLSSGSISSVVLITAFGLIVIVAVLFYAVAFFEGREISFYPPKIGEKPESKKLSATSSSAPQSGKKNPYGITVNKPHQEQTFYSEHEDLLVEVSGEYKIKPEYGKTLRFFTKTFDPIRYWYQSSIPDFSNGHWRGEVSLWKGRDVSPYSAVVVVVIVDEAANSLVRYAEKVHRETGRNIPFDNLPVYLEMCGEISVKRV